jgi:hypothetical protein
MEGIEQNFDASRREYHGEDEQLLDDFEWGVLGSEWQDNAINSWLINSDVCFKLYF